MSEIRRIGILTSGGDAPGMNAAIRAAVRTAVGQNISVLGIYRGYNGLINGDVAELDARSVDGIQVKGGTMLYTARCDEFRTEAGVKRAADTCRYLGIQGLIAIGGDGTFRGALDLSRAGVHTVGIPATIDNDIACTHYTIGFDTASNTAVEAIDKLRDTMQSHERCSIVEVMGNRSGNLTMYVGIAVGASSILIPERPIDVSEIYEKIRISRIRGRHHHIIVTAEGVGNAHELAEGIRQETGLDTRVTTLGHIQRGGSPTARDRVTATRMGCRAVDALLEGKSSRVICNRNGIITDMDIEEALALPKEIHEDMFQTASRITY
ncbi:MAG: 6-phosphofructokinase [Ruminococcaceae bacterium]|nr:6-phosphofructokinase [Oscillospiraceae bacterium]